MEDDNLSEIRPLDKVAARREQNRLRKQRERDRKREHQQLVVFDQPPSPSVVTCHAVTPAPTPSIPSIGVTPHRSSASLTVLACGLAIIGLGINGWFAWNRGTTDIDKCLMAGLGFLAEGTMFYLPARAAELWRRRRWGAFGFAMILWPFLFVFALTNSLGFASINLADVAAARAGRTTPQIEEAKQKVDSLAKSRDDECRKRGDKCRDLESREQKARDDLKDERDKVGDTADPQVKAAAKLTAWASLGLLKPTADDFGMLRLLLLTLLPQLGGLVLMVARR